MLKKSLLFVLFGAICVQNYTLHTEDKKTAGQKLDDFMSRLRDYERPLTVQYLQFKMMAIGLRAQCKQGSKEACSSGKDIKKIVAQLGSANLLFVQEQVDPFCDAMWKNQKIDIDFINQLRLHVEKNGAQWILGDLNEMASDKNQVNAETFM